MPNTESNYWTISIEFGIKNVLLLTLMEGLITFYLKKTTMVTLCAELTVEPKSANHTTTLTGVWTPFHLIVSHEHFLLAMCLHGSLICYVCYILSKDYRCCVKSIHTTTTTYRGSNTIPLDCVPWTFPLGHVPAWKSDLLRVLHIKWRLPLLCQKYTISSQVCCRLHNDLSDK